MFSTLHRPRHATPEPAPGSCPVIPLFPGSDPMAEPCPADLKAEMSIRAELSALARKLELSGRSAAGVTAVLAAAQ